MPRITLPPTFDARLEAIARRFARELWNLFVAGAEAAIADAVNRMAAPGAPPYAATKARRAKGSDGAARGATRKARRPARRATSSARTNELKRIAATKPVACPSPRCTNPGVRRFSNFCTDHYASLSKAEMQKLRDAQRRAQAAAAASAAAASAAAASAAA